MYTYIGDGYMYIRKNDSTVRLEKSEIRKLVQLQEEKALEGGPNMLEEIRMLEERLKQLKMEKEELLAKK